LSCSCTALVAQPQQQQPALRQVQNHLPGAGRARARARRRRAATARPANARLTVLPTRSTEQFTAWLPLARKAFDDEAALVASFAAKAAPAALAAFEAALAAAKARVDDEFAAANAVPVDARQARKAAKAAERERLKQAMLDEADGGVAAKSASKAAKKVRGRAGGARGARGRSAGGALAALVRRSCSQQHHGRGIATTVNNTASLFSQAAKAADKAAPAPTPAPAATLKIKASTKTTSSPLKRVITSPKIDESEGTPKAA